MLYFLILALSLSPHPSVGCNVLIYLLHAILHSSIGNEMDFFVLVIYQEKFNYFFFLLFTLGDQLSAWLSTLLWSWCPWWWRGCSPTIIKSLLHCLQVSQTQSKYTDRKCGWNYDETIHVQLKSITIWKWSPNATKLYILYLFEVLLMNSK